MTPAARLNRPYKIVCITPRWCPSTSAILGSRHEVVGSRSTFEAALDAADRQNAKYGYDPETTFVVRVRGWNEYGCQGLVRAPEAVALEKAYLDEQRRLLSLDSKPVDADDIWF